MKFIISIAAAIWLVIPMISSAHHSRAHYTGEMRELEGEVVRLRWGNPHTAIVLKTVNEAGEETTWQVDMLGMGGLTRDELEVGRRLTIAGPESIRGGGAVLGTNVLLPSGREVLLGVVEPVWSTNVEPVEVRAGVDVLVDGRAENRGLFRVWSRSAEDFAHYRRVIHRYLSLATEEERTRAWSEAILGAWRSEPYTEAAIAARADWDPLDNFTTRCEPEGMPRLMMNPHPFEFVDEGSVIRVRSELYDIDRSIHMDGVAAAVEVAPSPLGYSVGRWEGATLVVETTRVNWPWLDNNGTPQSPAVVFLERFTVSADQARLDYELTVTDPATFTEPAVYDRHFLALVGATIETYGCQVL